MEDRTGPWLARRVKLESGEAAELDRCARLRIPVLDGNPTLSPAGTGSIAEPQWTAPAALSSIVVPLPGSWLLGEGGEFLAHTCSRIQRSTQRMHNTTPGGLLSHSAIGVWYSVPNAHTLHSASRVTIAPCAKRSSAMQMCINVPG